MIRSRISILASFCIAATAAIAHVVMAVFEPIVMACAAIRKAFKSASEILFLKKPKPKCEPAITVSRMRSFTARMFTRDHQKPTVFPGWRSCPSC